MSTSNESDSQLSHRALAILRAVNARRATMTTSRVPDLFIDGFACCDQMTAHSLARNGYVRPASGVSVVGALVEAQLTDAGRVALGVPAAVA